jgi:hypothetical protein
MMAGYPVLDRVHLRGRADFSRRQKTTRDEKPTRATEARMGHLVILLT